jgi:hypothetical protein
MSVEKTSGYNRVSINPNSSLQIAGNTVSSDQTTSSLKTLVGNSLYYSTATFDNNVTTNLTVDTDTIISADDSTAFKGHVSIEGPSGGDISYIDLISVGGSGAGAALIYDSGDSAVSLSSTVVSGVTINPEYNYFTADYDQGHPRVNFTEMTAVSGTVDYMILNSGIDVPYANVDQLNAASADHATLETNTLSCINDATFNQNVYYNATDIVYSSGTTMSQYVHMGDSAEVRDAYMISASGVGASTKYLFGAGQLGDAADAYPGIEIQQKLPNSTQPTNFRI